MAAAVAKLEADDRLLLPIPEVIQLLGPSRATLDRLAKNDPASACRMGRLKLAGQVRYHRTALHAALQAFLRSQFPTLAPASGSPETPSAHREDEAGDDLPIVEAARLLSVSRLTLDRIAKADPAEGQRMGRTKRGGKVYYHRPTLEAYLQQILAEARK